MKRARVAFVVSEPATYAAFLKEHARILSLDFDISVIANFKDGLPNSMNGHARFIDVPIVRAIQPWNDVKALFLLWKILRQESFDVVHSVTPKAGLLAGLAGVLARQRVRIHTFTGQVWATRRGITRALLKMADRLTLACTTRSLADSHSQAEFLKAEGFGGSIAVLGNGSIAGVDATRFCPSSSWRSDVRMALSIPDSALVFCFLGRLNRDKGVVDLVEGFIKAGLGSGHVLMIVGPDEGDLSEAIRSRAESGGVEVRLTGGTASPEKYLAASDVFCLPSYREGFGSSVLEAAAVGLPAIVSRIYGLVDAVDEGHTGLCHPPGDIDAIALCLRMLAKDQSLRARMGESARMRAIEKFSPALITSELEKLYRDGESKEG